tara:strand:+ start:682 stop:984 length:303 start_codon:yes stop_codon:yes gene_type:complete
LVQEAQEHLDLFLVLQVTKVQILVSEQLLPLVVVLEVLHLVVLQKQVIQVDQGEVQVLMAEVLLVVEIHHQLAHLKVMMEEQEMYHQVMVVVVEEEVLVQ